MSSTRIQLSIKKSPFRSRKRPVKQTLRKKSLLRTRPSPSLPCYPQFLANLKQPGARFLSYTAIELEPICQQIAIEQMSSSAALVTSCPWICLLCEDLIVEPVTLYCGHTYCEQCIKDDDAETSTDCPRCPKNIQGQIASPINYAREHHYSRNHSLKETIERSQAFKFKCDSILACHKARNEYANGNYLQAVETLSSVIEKDANAHLALYGRAKAYIALKQLDNALTDIEQVVRLKPSWRKGYYCRSKILFEMQRFTAALLSSLQGLTLDPENQAGRQTMAQHLHAVLHSDEDTESVASTKTKREKAASTNDSANETITSGASDAKLLVCRSATSNSCLCSLFDHERLSVKDYDCSICVNLLCLPVTTPCGHVFCRECLIRSIDNTQAQCPICKNGLENFFPMLIQSYVSTTEIVAQIIETYLPTEFQERRQLYEQENIQGAAIPRQSPSSDESAAFEVPIFVCVAALPHSPCPLHVFEPRYRLMIRRAMGTPSRMFGMCAFDEETNLLVSHPCFQRLLCTFAEYGTLLYIRGLVYTQDGRSVVDTIGRQRFRVIDRGVRDEYSVAHVQLMHDNPVAPEEFEDLHQLNRTIYQNVRDWFDQLDTRRQTLITQQLEGYPVCDDLTQESKDGSTWSWQMLNLLPIEPHLQYSALTSQCFRTRLEIIRNTINFLLNQQQPTTVPTTAEES